MGSIRDTTIPRGVCNEFGLSIVRELMNLYISRGVAS